MAIRTVVWGENIHENTNAVVRGIYPDGMHATIANALNADPSISATTATLQEPEHGLSEARLAETDVLTWWGHKDHGAVSAPVARAMADGARNTARTDIAVSITGVAGPSGGTERKPVGLVYFAVATKDGTDVKEMRFGDIGREAIRQASVETALKMVLETLAKPDEH